MSNTWRWLFGVKSVKPPSHNRRRPALFRPTLEGLEERTVPSVYHVTTNADSGLGSLRSAVDAANTNIGADKIAFDASLSGKTIALTSGELLITEDLKINGLCAGQLTVSGGNISRVFEAVTGTTDTISGLTITGGNGAANPGGPGSMDGYGGAILNFGTLKISDSILSGNAALYNGGAIDNEGMLTVSSSVLFANSA